MVDASLWIAAAVPRECGNPGGISKGQNGGRRPDLGDLSLLKVEENHAGAGCPVISRIPAKHLTRADMVTK